MELSLGSEVLSVALKVLSNYPLCDRCLGRFFAQYAVGLNNLVRGKAIKVLLAMSIHRQLIKGEKIPLEELKEIAQNAGYPLTELYRSLTNDVIRPRKCYICNNELDMLIHELIIKAASKLKGLNIKTFVVGVKAGSSYEIREKSIAEELGISSWESIRREVKREVGKALQTLLNLKPNFKLADVLVLLDLDKKSVEVQIAPLYLMCKYLKLGRFISQMIWIGRNGKKKYLLSLEESCSRVVDVANGSSIKIHAAGREDVDVRMLGSGRPLIIEVKEARNRDVDPSKLSEIVSTKPWIIVKVEGKAKPSDVSKLKSEIHQKVYRAIVFCERGFSDDDVTKICENFRNTEIKQLTPLRVLRRKKETLRVKRVYEVQGTKLSDYLASFLIRCDGGLYVKELVHGDKGRTEPSFASVLGKDLKVIALDVIEYLDTLK